jgi:alpha-amylase
LLLSPFVCHGYLQILTDRFSPSSETLGLQQRCRAFQFYCGGTYEGIINHVDYIKDMGFSAVWVSPMSEQTKGEAGRQAG